MNLKQCLVKNPYFICITVSILCFCPGSGAVMWLQGFYVTQLSIRIRLTVGLSDRLTGSEWKSGRCCSSRSLPPSWELQEELMLSAGDLPRSALLDEVVEEWWGGGGGPWACVAYPDWLRWSRGGEIGSALMLMLWLVLIERLELADLQAVGQMWGALIACSGMLLRLWCHGAI